MRLIAWKANSPLWPDSWLSQRVEGGRKKNKPFVKFVFLIYCNVTVSLIFMRSTTVQGFYNINNSNRTNRKHIRTHKDVSLCHLCLIELVFFKQPYQIEEWEMFFAWMASAYKLVIAAERYSPLKFLSFLCKARRAAPATLHAASQWLQLC